MECCRGVHTNVVAAVMDGVQLTSTSHNRNVHLRKCAIVAAARQRIAALCSNLAKRVPQQRCACAPGSPRDVFRARQVLHG